MVILDIRIRDRSRIRGLSRRMRGFYKQTLIDGAHYWHRHILRRHFTSSARGWYGYRPRSARYTKWKRKNGVGQGKFLDLWLSGQSRRWLMESASVTATSGRAVLKMKAPWYFVNPNGRIKNLRGKKFSSREQPNKPDEVTRFNERDRQDVRRFCQQRLTFFINNERLATREVMIRG